ncbi:FAD-dependent monooxygenase [Nocardioides sp. NPDC101246]|uniref:FAD-dependent monooxygenase n=1 Tax=Nocardioides sp. NPDC101246 TaxID=3364336 RepID=UPI0037F6F97D
MSMQRVLVVGAGFTGLTAAIALGRTGVQVHVIDRVKEWAPVGHGLTIQGNALKVFKDLGIYDDLIRRACPEDNGVTLRLSNGDLLMHINTPRTGGEDLPPTIGTLRPHLHELLVAKAEEHGVTFQLGTELLDFENRGETAAATLSDGTQEEWDLVIVAEGIRSKTRAKLGISEEQASSGLGIWRGLAARTPEMDGEIFFPTSHDGGAYKAGYTPISDDQCYFFVLCPPIRPENGLEDWQEVRRLLEPFHGSFDLLRDTIVEDTFLNFQEIEWIFVDGPWHQGRVLALGEVVHAVPPLIAQGAAQCVEDSLVLAEHITQEGDLEEQLKAFYERRLPRVKGVVDASMQLARWEQNPGSSQGRDGEVLNAALLALTDPA